MFYKFIRPKEVAKSMPTLCIQVPDCIWTKALFDGSVKVAGFDVVFEAAPHDQRTSRRLRGEVEEPYAGAEQVLTDYIVRLSRGAEKELLALPIFVTRGMVHRKFVMRRGSMSPGELRGRAIGMGRVLGATSVYLRGLLQDHYGVHRNDARWLMAEPLTSDGAMGGEWAYTHQRDCIKASELVGRLSTGELDAVIYPGGAGGHWFNWVVKGGVSRTPDPYGDLEQMVASSSNLCFPCGDIDSHLAWFNKERIYPTYHFLAIRQRVAADQLGLADALVEAFQRAANGAPAYMSGDERKFYEREKELLGVDPNQCGLNAMHRRTVEKCMDYLEADGLLSRRPKLGEIFPLSES
jgi:4,5-dihydroxyphthalate decarboxylase